LWVQTSFLNNLLIIIPSIYRYGRKSEMDFHGTLLRFLILQCKSCLLFRYLDCWPEFQVGYIPNALPPYVPSRSR
jgi:hypothetical protein